MNLLEALDEAPHLSSPAALAIADTNGKFQVPAHIAYINRLLVEVAFGEMERLIVNIPFQHGKSWICSVYFCAWLLLLFPDKRILLAAHEERFASSFGQKVKDVLDFKHVAKEWPQVKETLLAQRGKAQLSTYASGGKIQE